MRHRQLPRFVQSLANFTKYGLILSFPLYLGMASSLEVKREERGFSVAGALKKWWDLRRPSLGSINSPLAKSESPISINDLSDPSALQLALAQEQSKRESVESRLREEEEVASALSDEASTKHNQLEEALLQNRLLAQKITDLIKENTYLLQERDNLSKEKESLYAQLEDNVDPLFTLSEQTINELSTQAYNFRLKGPTASAYIKNVNLLLQNYRLPLMQEQKAALLSFWGIEEGKIPYKIKSTKESSNHDQ